VAAFLFSGLGPGRNIGLESESPDAGVGVKVAGMARSYKQQKNRTKI
jgi:hypothetical protein